MMVSRFYHTTQKFGLSTFSLSLCEATGVGCDRSRTGKSTGRSLHQRSAAAQSHPAQDRTNGIARRASMRHQSHVTRVARLCQQNTTKISGEFAEKLIGRQYFKDYTV